MRVRIVSLAAAALILMAGTTPATAMPAAKDKVPSAWVGAYQAHASGLSLSSDGRVRLSYIVDFANPDGSPDFPEIAGRVVSRDGRVLRVRITESTDRKQPVGSTLKLRKDGLGFRVYDIAGLRSMSFCDGARQGMCGA
jgi:hypothetical protein